MLRACVSAVRSAITSVLRDPPVGVARARSGWPPPARAASAASARPGRLRLASGGGRVRLGSLQRLLHQPGRVHLLAAAPGDRERAGSAAHRPRPGSRRRRASVSARSCAGGLERLGGGQQPMACRIGGSTGDGRPSSASSATIFQRSGQPRTVISASDRCRRADLLPPGQVRQPAEVDQRVGRPPAAPPSVTRRVRLSSCSASACRAPRVSSVSQPRIASDRAAASVCPRRRWSLQRLLLERARQVECAPADRDLRQPGERPRHAGRRPGWPARRSAPPGRRCSPWPASPVALANRPTRFRVSARTGVSAEVAARRSSSVHCSRADARLAEQLPQPRRSPRTTWPGRARALRAADPGWRAGARAADSRTARSAQGSSRGLGRPDDQPCDPVAAAATPELHERPSPAPALTTLALQHLARPSSGDLLPMRRAAGPPGQAGYTGRLGAYRVASIRSRASVAGIVEPIACPEAA